MIILKLTVFLLLILGSWLIVWALVQIDREENEDRF